MPRRYEPNVDYNKYFFDVPDSYVSLRCAVLDAGGEIRVSHRMGMAVLKKK